MQTDDARWLEKWARTDHTPRPHNFSRIVLWTARLRRFGAYGTDREPDSSVWLASLSEAMQARFREGMSVLDYGCGAGRYARFLQQRLETFEYFGVERPAGQLRHGEKSIELARWLFRRDERVAFGLIGSPFESDALARVEVVVLGSIFTHVEAQELVAVLEKMSPVVERGGTVVFSIFIADEYDVEDGGAYGFDDCYTRVWYTRKQLNDVFTANGWVGEERESFVAQEINRHRIFAVTRASSR